MHVPCVHVCIEWASRHSDLKNLSEEQETEVKQSKTAWACSDECTIWTFTYFLIFLCLNLGKNLIPFYDHQFSDVFGLI